MQQLVRLQVAQLRCNVRTRVAGIMVSLEMKTHVGVEILGRGRGETTVLTTHNKMCDAITCFIVGAL